ncbi:hypothetical protein ACLOJK_010185 [Asimina triloba]
MEITGNYGRESREERFYVAPHSANPRLRLRGGLHGFFSEPVYSQAVNRAESANFKRVRYFEFGYFREHGLHRGGGHSGIDRSC